MGTFARFLRLESLAGIALVAAAIVGMLFANTGLAELYGKLLSTPLSVALGGWGLEKPLLLWINDGLMAIFFLLVALELKRELLEGELSRPDQIALPLVGAVGGIAIPALIFWLFNRSDPVAAQGWAIPAATDIAFALGVVALLGDRVPHSLKAFLLSLAVFDDLGAILIIAAFYTDEISWSAHAAGAVLTLILIVLNRAGVTRTAPYLLIGAVLWFCVLKSGVHATLAGVVVGLTIPHKKKNYLGASPLKDLEHSLHPWVAFGVIPIFAFSNAGVRLTGGLDAVLDPIALGIIVGLVVGKLVGVSMFAGTCLKLGWIRKPAGFTWRGFLGVCALSGIGFTMSLFIGTLAYEHVDRDLAAPVRVGVLGGSLIAAALGAALLLPRGRAPVVAGESEGAVPAPEDRTPR